MNYTNFWASLSTENVYPFMLILLIVSLNCSGKEPNFSVLSNAIMLSISSKKNYAICHLYNTQTLQTFQIVYRCIQLQLVWHLTSDPRWGTSPINPNNIFVRSFNKHSNLWNVTQKECYALYRSINKFSFYLTGAKCTLCCDHKPLAPFLMTGMKSKTIKRWGLKLQQYNNKISACCRQG